MGPFPFFICTLHFCHFCTVFIVFIFLSFLATVSWLVKFLRFAISYFVFHDTVCDWSKPLILKQLHLSFFLANHIKTNLCCHANLCRIKHVRLSTTSSDARVRFCRNLYFSKYKYPFESDETFITEFRWQSCAFWQPQFRLFHSVFCPEFDHFF